VIYGNGTQKWTTADGQTLSNITFFGNNANINFGFATNNAHTYIVNSVFNNITGSALVLGSNGTNVGTMEFVGGTRTNCTYTVTGVGNQFTQSSYYNLNVQDKNGANISGATVTLVDNLGATVFLTTTDASGNITQQQIGYWTKTSAATTSYTFTLTISKSGYQTITKLISNAQMAAAPNEIEVLVPALGYGYVT
jgi:hypothetical protein